MKNIILSSLFMVAVLGTVSSQRIIIKTYVEKTQMSPKTGTSLSYENSYGWELGGFFQESSLMETMTMNNEERADLPRFYEKEFYGAFFSVPVKRSEMVDVKVQIRTGVTNGQNFTITPSLLADYKPLRNVRLGLGMGVRMLRPTMQGSVSISF